MEKMQLFAGLDVHQDTITATIKDDAGNNVRVLKVETVTFSKKTQPLYSKSATSYKIISNI